MTGNDVRLYIKTPPLTNSPLGNLGFRRIEFDDQSPKALKIVLQFIPWSQTFQNLDPVRWAWLEAEVWSQRIEPRVFGRLDITSEQRPWVSPPTTTEVAWRWLLRPDDIELIECDYLDAAKSPRSFKVLVRGIIQVGADVQMVEGEGNFQIGVSDWEALIGSLGYSVRPSLAGLIGEGAIASGYWAEADKRLALARKHLRHGEPYHALIACLGEFERVVPKCYDPTSWRPLLSGDHEQRASSIAGWLGGHCTLLNRIGHHKARADRDATGDLVQMPLSTWEADLIVAASHVLLTYALRLRDGTQSG